jgi:hypothetical protein
MYLLIIVVWLILAAVFAYRAWTDPSNPLYLLMAGFGLLMAVYRTYCWWVLRQRARQQRRPQRPTPPRPVPPPENGDTEPGGRSQFPPLTD